jgi:hypothetical protein
MSLSKYTPSPAPLNKDTLPEYVLRELNRIGGLFQQYSEKFDQVDASLSAAGGGGLTDHNSLSGIQGGTVGEYYHLTSAEYAALGASGAIDFPSLSATALSASTTELYYLAWNPSASAKFLVAGSAMPGAGGGGGSGSSPVSPDDYPASPSAYDDEFEGASLSSIWTWLNQGSCSVTFADGMIRFWTPPNGNSGVQCIEQTVSGTWKFRTKINSALMIPSNFCMVGLFVRDSTSGRMFRYTFQYDGGMKLRCARLSDYITYNLNLAGTGKAIGDSAGLVAASGWHIRGYLEIEYDGTTFYFRYSKSGGDHDFEIVTQDTAASYVSAPDRIGIGLYNQNTAATATLGVTFDWFRKYA